MTNALFATLIQAAGAMHAEFNLDDELRKIEPGGPLDALMAARQRWIERRGAIQ